jgi:hypothetical protein
MAFKKPSYADRAQDLMRDPAKMVIQGPVCWALGWPPLDHEVNTRITPTQFQRVQSLRAGLGAAKGERNDKEASLKSVRSKG